MELLCSKTDCGKPIESHDDLINFKNADTKEWMSYHRACYAEQFNAPHAIIKK